MPRLLPRLSLASVISAASIAGLALCGNEAFFAAATAVTAPACTSVDAAPYTSVTGIVIRAASLTQGLGCGTGPGEVFRYVAVVVAPAPNDAGNSQDAGASPLIAGNADCFGDLAFPAPGNCLPSDASAATFGVNIYAFTADAWQRANGYPLDAAVLTGNNCTEYLVDAGNGNVALVNPFLASDENTIRAEATWATTCTATLEPSVAVLATCGPLTPVGAGSSP